MKQTNGNPPRRGDVFWVNFDPTQGTETKKIRPAIVLSNNVLNKHLPRLVVVPVTSNTSKVFDFDALVSIDAKPGKAMLDQMRAIDKSRLGKKICTLAFEEMEKVDKALRLVLSL